MTQRDDPVEPEQSHEARGNLSDDEGSSNTMIASLFYEQRRLRTELDRLRLERSQGASRARETGDDKKVTEDKKADAEGNEGSKDVPKEPFFKRLLKWTAAHPITTVAILILILAAMVGGWFLWAYLQSYETTDDAQIDGHVNAISSRIAGTVTIVRVENNQNVNAGDLAVELDPRDYEVALAQQKANLAQARANIQIQNPNVSITQVAQVTNVGTAELDVTTARAGYVAQQQQVQSALADLKQAEANAANAAAEETRYRTLVDKQEVSRELYEQKLADSRAQTAIVSSRQATVDVARKTVDQRSAALEQAFQRFNQAKQASSRQNAIQQSTVAAREAAAQISQTQVDQAALNLAYCKIYIPVSGVIGNKTVEIGAQISVGQELFDVTSGNDVWITANYKETQLRQMRPGQSVTVHVDTLDRKFEGYVEDMPGATGARYSLLPPENATGNYVKVVQRLPVRIRLKPNQDGSALLRIGMSVEPKVWLK